MFDHAIASSSALLAPEADGRFALFHLSSVLLPERQAKNNDGYTQEQQGNRALDERHETVAGSREATTQI